MFTLDDEDESGVDLDKKVKTNKVYSEDNILNFYENSDSDEFMNLNFHQLNNLQLMVNKDGLFENFLKSQVNEIDYDLIIKKILLPYFKIKSRILTRGSIFKIGEISFKVTGTTPCKEGVVSSKTFIHCNNYYSTIIPIKRALMITTTKLNNFSQESLFQELLANPRETLAVNKNEIAKLNQYEFYVRNCEPEAGVISAESAVTFENKDLVVISKMKIAIIKVRKSLR